MPDRFSVIICAYTEARWDDLLKAVDSLRRQAQPPAEIILVVDHNPRLFERARAGLPGIRVVENRGPRGLSAARNAGIAEATGSLIAFMDEDAVAAPDWLARLASGYTDPRVLGVGGQIIANWEAGRPGWFPEEFDWVVGCTYRGMPETAALVRNLIGCNMSFRREVFEAVGGFRSDMGRIGTRPVGCEETELCIRAFQRRPGGYFLYEPQAEVFHKVPEARGHPGYYFARCYSEGLSKAQVIQWVGESAGLSTERAYTLKTLPLGALRALAEAVSRGRPSALARAAAIPAGLLVTTAGYLAGRIAAFGRRSSQEERTPAPVPVTGSLPQAANPEDKEG